MRHKDISKNSFESPGFQIWQLTNLWQRHMRTELEKFGITHVQFLLLTGLKQLTDQDDYVTQVQLASYTSCHTMMTSKVIRTLEQKKLVKRIQHPTDTRAKCLDLTVTGLELAAKARNAVTELNNHFFEKIKPKESEFETAVNTLIISNQNDDNNLYTSFDFN